MVINVLFQLINRQNASGKVMHSLCNKTTFLLWYTTLHFAYSIVQVNRNDIRKGIPDALLHLQTPFLTNVEQ